MPDTLNISGKPEPQEQELQTQALSVIESAKIVRITDQATYDTACSLLLEQIKPFRKRWLEYWSSVKNPAWAAYQAIQKKFTEGDKPLEEAERQVKLEIARWDAEQEKIRQQKQREAEEAARLVEEEERLRIATMAEQSGATEEEVSAIVDTPVTAVAPPVAPTYQKASGIGTRENWKARVTDMKKLCAAIAKGTVPVTYVLPNQSALDARAKADKGTLNIPGIVPYNDPIISGRSR
jgi:hypothetical protein